MKAAPLLRALALALAAVPAWGGPRVSVVAEDVEPLRAPLVGKLGAGYEVVVFRREELSDPIRKGELLARLQRDGALVVPVGDAAAKLIFDELEESRIFFVGASVVPGDRMASPAVSGILSYSADGVLEAAAALGLKRVGYAKTPGYEKIAAAARAAAAARGLTFEERLIESPHEVPEDLKALFERSQAVWLSGDPRLTRGAGFQHAIERSLTRRVPLLVSGRWGVEHGGLLACMPPAEPLAAQAAETIRLLAGGGKLAESDRIRLAPAGGKILYNAALADRLGLKVPADKWTPLR